MLRRIGRQSEEFRRVGPGDKLPTTRRQISVTELEHNTAPAQRSAGDETALFSFRYRCAVHHYVCRDENGQRGRWKLADRRTDGRKLVVERTGDEHRLMVAAATDIRSNTTPARPRDALGL